MPNDELKRNLNLAKRATPEKRLFFALAVKDKTKGALLVSKRKIAPIRLQKAKKECQATALVTGTCYTGGGKLLFESLKKPESKWKSLVQHLAKHEAQVTLTNVAFVQGDRSEDDFAEAEFDVYEEHGDVAPDLAEEELQKKAGIEAKLMELRAKLLGAGKLDQDVQAMIDKLNDQINRFMALPDYDAAQRTLNNLNLLLDTALQGKSGGKTDLKTQELVQRVRKLWPQYQEAINAPTSLRATLQQTLGRANGHIQQKEYAKAGEALDQLEQLIPQALEARDEARKLQEARTLKQAERHNKLSPLMTTVKDGCFLSQEDRAGLMNQAFAEGLKPGKEFKAFQAALRKFEGARTLDNLELVEKAARVYLAHLLKLTPAQQTDEYSTKKKAVCERALREATRWRTALAWEELGAPPWSDDQESQAAELYSKMIFEGGNPEEKIMASVQEGVTTCKRWWVDAPPKEDQGQGRRKFLFKPMDGEMQVHRGFAKGGHSAREVLGKALGDCIQSSTGLDLDVPETHLISVDSSWLEDPFRLDHEPPMEPQLLGSIQHFVKTSRTVEDLVGSRVDRLRDLPIPREESQKLAILDLISLNMDRHYGNFMVKEGEPGKLVPIDHGTILPTREGLLSKRARLAPPQAMIPQLGHTNEPFTEDMLKKLDGIDEEEVLKSLKDAVLAMGKRHPGAAKAAQISKENLELVRWSIRFLKRAAREGLTLAEIYDAYAQDTETIFDSTDEDMEEAFDKAIQNARARTPARERCERDLMGPDAQAHLQRLADAGWLLEFCNNDGRPNLEKARRWCLQHVQLVADLLEDPRQNTALIQELERKCARMERPMPQDGTPFQKWQTVTAAYEQYLRDRQLADPLAQTVRAALRQQLGNEPTEPMVAALRQDLVDYMRGGGDDLLRRHRLEPTKLGLQEKVRRFKQLYLAEPEQHELVGRAKALGLLPDDSTQEAQLQAIKDLAEYDALGGDDAYSRLGGGDEASAFTERLNALRQLAKLEHQGRGEPNLEAELKEREEEALVQRVARQGVRHGKLSGRMAQAKGQCFVRGTRQQPGLLYEAEHAERQGVKFKEFVAALKKAERDRSEENLNAVVQAADSYIEHFQRLEERQGDEESQKKYRLCIRAKQDVARWRTALAFEALGAPPWDEQAETVAAELYTKWAFEHGDSFDGDEVRETRKLATPAGNQGGISVKWTLETTRKNGEVGPKYLFKPIDGINDLMLGFPKGGEAPREVLGKAIGDQLQTVLGVELGVPETHLVEIDNERLPGQDGEIDRTKPPQRLGSMQHWDKHGKPLSGRLEEDPGLKDRIPVEECQKMAVLDLVTLNMDRNPNNFLVEERDGQTPKLVPIDHGMILPSREGLKQRRHRLGGAYGAIPRLPGSRQPFTDEMKKKIEEIDEDEVIQGIRDSLQTMKQRHPEAFDKAQVGEDNLELARRSIRFLKKAAAAQPPLNLTDIYDAYAHDLEKIFDSSEKEMEQRFDEAITNARQRSADRTRCEELVLGPNGVDNRERLNQLGWLPDLNPYGKSSEVWALEHARLVVKVLDRQPQLENTALRRELDGWLEELPVERRPPQQEHLSQYWATVRDVHEAFKQAPRVVEQIGEKAAQDLKKAFGKQEATPAELQEMRQDLLDYTKGKGDQLLTQNGVVPAKLTLSEKVLKFKELKLEEPSTAKLLERARARGVDFGHRGNVVLTPQESLKKKLDTIKALTAYEELGGDAEYARLGGLDSLLPESVEGRLRILRSLQMLVRHEATLE
jgi:hypothetical protein